MALRHAFCNTETIDKRLKKMRGTPFVYFLYDIEGHLIYIGRSMNIYERLQTHKQYKEFDVTLLIVCESYRESVVLETKRIRKYKPFFNRR